MKVIHFCKGYLPELAGGMEQAIKEIVQGTSQLGLDVEVLCLSNNGSNVTRIIDGNKIHFHRTSFRIASTPISISALFRVTELVKDADIIHYHHPYPFSDFVHLITNIKKPTVITYHSDIVRQKNLLWLYAPLMHKFLSSADRIVATSPNYLSMSKVLSCYGDKTCVIPIGLEKEKYPTASNERLTYWRNRSGQKFFLFIGVLRYYKGLFILLQAVKKSGYPFVVVGTGPLENELKNIVANEGIKNIEFTGWVPNEDKVALLMLCHGLVLPSNLTSEAFGVALLEGAMFGKPLISCEIGTGTSFINIDKDTGLVVRPGDSEALRTAMEYLWDHPDEATTMGARAKARYHRLFKAKTMARLYVQLYDEITNNN
jgi:rhamnosyl/mannosyltransferase